MNRERERERERNMASRYLEEPFYKETSLMACALNYASDQPAHPRSLMRA